MSLSEIMATLADQYVIGITICCLIVSGLYIAFSVRLIITARSEGCLLYTSPSPRDS